MNNETPSYYAILTAEVRYDNDLKANEKLLYAEITALTKSSGKCFASNKYFADLYGVSTVSISKWVNNLVKKGYLQSEIIYKEGTKQILNRYLTIVCDPIKQKFDTPIKQKFKDNNTSINNTSIINDFEYLWKLYGKVGSKDKAKKKYLSKSFKYKKEDVELAISRYLSKKEDWKSKQYFTTFLNNISDWLEDYEEEVTEDFYPTSTIYFKG